MPNGDVLHDNKNLQQNAFIEEVVQFEPAVQKMESYVEIIAPKDYKGLWKWAYRQACKQVGIQVGLFLIKKFLSTLRFKIINRLLLNNWEVYTI